MSKRWRRVLPHGQDGLNLLLGRWLFAAPWVPRYEHAELAAWHSRGLGLLIAVGALWALVRFAPWEEWINAAFGVWLIIAPWLLVWNHVLCLTALLAMWSLMAHDESHPATT